MSSRLYPRLGDCRSGAIKTVLRFVYGSGSPDSEAMHVWRALALMLDDELRFRNPRRKPLVPRSGPTKGPVR